MMAEELKSWAPDKTDENFARGKRIEYVVQRILNNVFEELGCNKFSDCLGFQAKVVGGAPYKEDLFVYLFDYSNNVAKKKICQIEVEERKDWAVPNGGCRMSEKEILDSWPKKYPVWSLLNRKIKDESKYIDSDVYVIVSRGASGGACLWWIFGEVRKGLEEKEYYPYSRSEDYREKYVRKSTSDERGVYKGWISLANYLLDLYGEKSNEKN